MWNTTIPSEFTPGFNSTQPSDGVAPRQYDFAHHVYLEKRRAHAEMDRRSRVQAVWRTMSQWAYDTCSQRCQKAPQWFNVPMGRTVSETSRP
jgi:hypothetical protein